MIQIETPEAVEEVDAIAAVEGISILFIGPGDLSFTLGEQCQPDAAHIVDAMERTAAAAERNGLAWGMPVLSLEHGQRILEMGGRFLAQGGDTSILAKAVAEKKEELASIMAPYV